MNFFLAWLRFFLLMLIPVLCFGFYVSRPKEFIPGRALWGNRGET